MEFDLEQNKSEEKVPMEMAISEVNTWLDHKKVKPKKREAMKGMIDLLVDAIVAGELSLMEDMKWKHTLAFPLTGEGGSVSVSEITYLPRMNDAMKEQYRRGLKGDDLNTQTLLTLCALTRQPINVIRNLDDSTDRSVADAIAFFFM